MTFDPRSIGTPVYAALSSLKLQTRDDTNRLKQQKVKQLRFTPIFPLGE